MARFARNCALFTAAAALFAAAPADAAKKKPKPPVPPITISGTVYTFDNQDPIPGATVRVAELPDLATVSGTDGGYSLEIPGGTKFTPYADAPDHERIHLQTWVSAGEDIRGVNFQMPTDLAYQLLALVTGAPLDQNGRIIECAVVSTFVNQAVRDLTFPEFVAFGAHGVAGATGTASPALPPPLYFNEQVLPDRSRTSSSVDGGVIWPTVPAGEFRFEGLHPEKRFARFTGTCAPGRVVNANPVQGLYELRPGEEVDDRVDTKTEVVFSSPEAKRPRARVRVRAREYVRVTAQLSAGERVLRTRATTGWAPGMRKLPMGLPRKLPRTGPVKVTVRIEDAEGNVISRSFGRPKATG